MWQSENIVSLSLVHDLYWLPLKQCIIQLFSYPADPATHTWIYMWNCTISEYSFQNLNEIVWRKSEKFENEAQPSFKFFTISEDDFMKNLKRVRGWVQFLINNTTWQNWACLDAAFVVRHCTYSEEFEKLWTIWEIVNNFKANFEGQTFLKMIGNFF